MIQEQHAENFDPLIFAAYRNLAAAVLKSYYKDRDTHRRKLKQQKEILVRRLETGSNKILVKQIFTPLEAWQSWNASLSMYNAFIEYEKSDAYEFYETFQKCDPEIFHQLGQYKNYIQKQNQLQKQEKQKKCLNA